PPVTTLTAAFLALSALAFGILYALMARFVVYAVPLITLASVFSMQRPSGPGRPRVRLVGSYTVPLAAGLVAALLCRLGTPWLGSGRVVEGAGRVFLAGTRADFRSFGAALPVGAKVFAPWAATEEFVFWAPQGRYLDVLDPIFMIERDPGLYRAYLEVLEAREPDIPLVAKMTFDSDFFADDGQYPLVRARLAQDPRAEIVHDGVSYLYRIVEGRNRDFMLDWKIVPGSPSSSPSPDVLAGTDLAPYPRSDSDGGRAVEGFVDASRVAAGCVTLARIEHASGREVVTLEVAPYGAAELYVDGELRVGIPPRSA